MKSGTTTGNGGSRLNSVSPGKLILRETRMDIPKPLQTCNPPDFKFYPSKLLMKISPIWSNVKWSFLFIVKFIVKCNESEHKINSFIVYI